MQKSLDDFYLFGSTNKNLITNDEIKNYNLNQSPLINGKKTEMMTAINKIKKIIKGRTLHFDGLICDQRSQYSILPSIYSLFIKKGGKLDFDEYIKIIVKNKKFDFDILYKEYLKFFKRKQILVLFFEELKKKPKKYVTKILNFMEIRNQKIDVNIQSHFKNASPGSEYIYFTLLLNKILNLEIPTRYMNIEKRKRILNNLRKRRKFLHPVFFILNRFRGLLRTNKLQLNLKQKKLIKQTYSKSNQQFFENIGNKTYRKNYP